MSDRWLRREDLAAFAVGMGVGTAVANGLWRLIEGELSKAGASENYPGLTLRCVGTHAPWKGDRTNDSEVSLDSLLLASQEIYPHFAVGYGPASHELFCRWAKSLKD